MTDPTRWLDSESDADAIERQALASGLGIEPPPGTSEQVWRRVFGVIEGPPDGGSDGDSSSGPSDAGGLETSGAGIGVAAVEKAGLLAALKTFLVGAGAGAIVASGAALVSGNKPGAGMSTPHQVASASVAVAERGAGTHAPRPEHSAQPESVHAVARQPSQRATAAMLPVETTVEAAAGSVATFSDLPGVEPPKPLSSSSQLRAEAEMIRQARAHLGRGELSQAFAVLEASRLRFPAPALGQEREALGIQLMLRSGQRELAVERARAFVTSHPDSPHAAELRRLLAGDP